MFHMNRISRFFYIQTEVQMSQQPVVLRLKVLDSLEENLSSSLHTEIHAYSSNTVARLLVNAPLEKECRNRCTLHLLCPPPSLNLANKRQNHGFSTFLSIHVFITSNPSIPWCFLTRCSHGHTLTHRSVHFFTRIRF